MAFAITIQTAIVATVKVIHAALIQALSMLAQELHALQVITVLTLVKTEYAAELILDFRLPTFVPLTLAPVIAIA